MKPLKIGIVGGSLAGLFAAILLQRDGHYVRVYERSAEGLGGRGAGLVGQEDLYTVLRLIGLEEVADVGVLAKERIYLDRSGSVLEAMRTPQMQISWDFMYNAVAEQLEPGRYILGRQVHSVEDDENGATIIFGDGTSEHADLIIGADGIGSVVRKSLHPSAYENHYAGYVAWRGLMPEGALPAAASLLLDRFTFFVTHGNHMLGYLVPGPNGEMARGSRRFNWVWFRRVPPSDLFATFTDIGGRSGPFSLPRGGLSLQRRATLREDAHRLLPPQFALAVDAEDRPSIQGIFDYEAPSMVGKSIALVGDAAFVVRPHTAMGASKAAGDVMALRAALASSSDLATALRRFDRDRLQVGRDIAAYGRRLGDTAL